MYSVYIIYSKKLDKYYIGYSEDLEKRLNQHNEGISKFTSRANDWQMLYSEPFATRIEALAIEKEIKNKKSRRYIEYLISSVG